MIRIVFAYKPGTCAGLFLWPVSKIQTGFGSVAQKVERLVEAQEGRVRAPSEPLVSKLNLDAKGISN